MPADAHALQGDAAQVGGFSLHAGVVAQAHERDQLERLCRYITRPAIAERRLSISPQGRMRHELKTPWRNGTTHVEFEPIDFIAKLAALAGRNRGRNRTKPGHPEPPLLSRTPMSGDNPHSEVSNGKASAVLS